MAVPKENIQSHNDDIRKYVLQRDSMCCQWPGCGSTLNVDVLFLIETENGRKTTKVYKNGITLCPKHMDLVNLHETAFAPLIFDLIQLIEFERDLSETEKLYKGILNS